MTAFSSKSRLPLLQQLTIERAALLENLQRALLHKLTLIAAQPGYGKTTLVAQFARQTSLPTGWHTVEENERDLPHLLAHCLTILGEIVGDIDKPLLSSATTPTEAAKVISEWLRNAMSEEIVYVFDDVHHLLGSSRAETWLRTFVAVMPNTCHVILIGRALPALPMTDMIAHREVVAIGQEQLRFTFKDIQTLAGKMGVSISAPEIQKITKQLDGWAAGTILALQPFPKDIEESVWGGNPGPEALFDSLAGTMLSAQEERLQDFLLNSSTLTRVTPALCQMALQLPNSRDHFFETIHNNLFVSQIEGGITFHPLFRAFLQRRLQSLDPDRFMLLHERAGYWFESNNHLEEAFDHFVTAKCYRQAVVLAERATQDYGAQGKTETVLYWSSQLLDTQLECPQLLYTCAAIHVERYAFEEAFRELTAAAQGFEHQRNQLGLLKVSLLRASIYNRRGDHHHAVQIVDDSIQNTPVPDNYRGLALYIRGSANLQLGHLEDALKELDTALPLYRATGDAAALSELLLELEYAYMRIGRFNEATAFLQEAIEIRRAFGGNAGLVVPLNNLGYDYQLLGDYRQALNSFQEGLTAASRAGTKREESYLFWSMGDLQRDLGADDEARSYYNKALHSTHAQEPTLRCAVFVGLATLERWQGNFDASMVYAGNAAAIAEKHQLPLEQAQASLAQWAARRNQGQEADARLALEQLSETFQRQQSFSLWAKALVLCALCALLKNNPAAANQYLKTVEGIDHETHLQPSVAEIMHIPMLKNFLLEHSTRYPLLLSGMKQLGVCLVEGAANDLTVKTVEAITAYSLRIRIFGQEYIERDGETVPLSAWRAADARRLFFYLLLKGAATREQLELALWPESSPQQVKLKFHTTLHRARHAVGTNTIHYEDELYSIDRHLDLWSDAVEFGALVQEARLSPPSRAHTESLWRRASGLYTGELLPAIDADWLVSQREAFHEMYLESLFAMGNCVRQRGNVREAISIYQQALEIDPYREDIHRAVLSSYAALGESPLVRRHIERLTQLFDLDLGITPSVETRMLAQSLLN
jgi:LuxR family maltose regulon positive regulatory protein